MAELDLVIRGGRIVNAGDVGTADVGILGGVIAQIGGEMHAAREIDAMGRLLLPGGIDAHVHLSSPPERMVQEHRWVDDFTSGSRAALAGGITTLGNMTFLASGETPLAGLAREAAVARAQTITDLFLHPVLGETTPAVLDEIPRLLDAGCNTIKFFMSTSSFDTQVRGYVEATRRAGASDLLTLIHCEDDALMADAVAQLTAAGQTALRHYAASRPVIAEVVATQRAVAIAEATGAPVYIVHLSSERALAVCADAQARGVPIYVETRPFYLHLTRERLEEEDGAKYVGQPPLREQCDVDALWAGIQQGAVNTVCTDHAPWSLAA
ncbi:MAG: amidohydrolase family protein, partial [Chloroflexota bacterium]|nr:amidohydrolase family protein [Chloroflexota bacterium]